MWKVIVIGIALASLGVAVAVYAVIVDGNLPDAQSPLGAIDATATYGSTPQTTPTHAGDPGIATHIALLTMTPRPISTKPADKTAQAPTPDPGAPPEPTLVAGLSDVLQGPFEPSIFSLQNQWQGPIGSDTHWMMVGAGAKKNETDGGVGPAAVSIYEFTTTPEGHYAGNFAHVGLFVAPTDSGLLTIVSVSGSLVELRTEGGETLWFNLVSLTFQ